MPFERVLRWALVSIAVAGLTAGIFAFLAGRPALADLCWTFATAPVVAGLAVSIARVSLPKTRFVCTGDAILPRLHVRRCPRSARSGARPAHPFRAKHEDATHYNRR